MKTSDGARRTRLSISTIRLYEKSGLCPVIKRANDEHRRTDRLNWTRAELPVGFCTAIRSAWAPMPQRRTGPWRVSSKARRSRSVEASGSVSAALVCWMFLFPDTAFGFTAISRCRPSTSDYH